MRQLPSLLALRSFESAARLESFARAAAELHLTPSAISHQVRALEAWLECALFARGSRRVALTDGGRRLLEAMTPALDRIEDVCAELRPTQARTLDVHCAPSFASKWLGPRLAGFMHLHPEFTLRFSSSAEPARFDGDEGPVDIDIAYGEPARQAGIEVGGARRRDHGTALRTVVRPQARAPRCQGHRQLGPDRIEAQPGAMDRLGATERRAPAAHCSAVVRPRLARRRGGGQRARDRAGDASVRRTGARRGRDRAARRAWASSRRAAAALRLLSPHASPRADDQDVPRVAHRRSQRGAHRALMRSLRNSA